MKKLLSIMFFCFITVLNINAKVLPVVVGAECLDEYLPLIKEKKVAVLSNHTGMIKEEHLVDVLCREKINIVAIFSPEHGFRGNKDAGEHVQSSIDEKTGIPICSLYDGKSKEINNKILNSFETLVVDLQDVGLRYYTYYVTMVRMMDICANSGKKVIILDRPNPNGSYVDGPILDMKYKSGVGWLPIPIVHGMTLGELANMVKGEKWLTSNRECDLVVVKCKNYTHHTIYSLPVPPSPNLPNMKSIYLYPSTCFFEGTPISLGRGTNLPFQVYGHPNLKGYSYTFMPLSIHGAKNPPLLNRVCYGVDLSRISDDELLKKGVDLSYIIDAYNNLNIGDHFFSPFFELLVGKDYVRKMIKEGKSASEIKAMWQDDVLKFKKQRAPYLLYAE